MVHCLLCTTTHSTYRYMIFNRLIINLFALTENSVLIKTDVGGFNSPTN